MEHRWGQRLAVRARVGLRVCGGSRTIGYIRDVSISGALIVTGMRPVPMSCVKIFLHPRPLTRVPALEGHVVRCTDSGFAVEWSDLAPDLVRSLAQTRVVASASMEHGVATVANRAVPRRQHAIL